MTEPSLRRARPLLGTLVEIQTAGLPAGRLARAVEKAFAAIARVQALMSFHDPASDLSRLNRLAARRTVRVDAATWSVLRHAVALSRASEGRFDPTIAPVLQHRGLLPLSPSEVARDLRARSPKTSEKVGTDQFTPTSRGRAVRSAGAGTSRSPSRDREVASPEYQTRADWRAIRLLTGNRVRFLAPLTLDLGGIAKGYAVDRAVAVLRRAGVPCGLVNAGGDLRVFGDHRTPVHVRHPKQSGVFFPLGELSNGALATSALTFSNALIDPETGSVCGQGVSITVLAPTACLADALTKVVAVAPDAARPLLARHRARAVILDTQGRAAWLDDALLRHVA